MNRKLEFKVIFNSPLNKTHNIHLKFECKLAPTPANKRFWVCLFFKKKKIVVNVILNGDHPCWRTVRLMGD